MAVFVTGATGFLGRYLVQGLLDEGEDVALLTRGDSDAHAVDRARRSLAWFERGSERWVGGRVQVCRGTLEAPGLGLSPDDRERIVATCDSFLHCGASVRFDLPLDEARTVNLGGTRGVLELAEERHRRGVLRRLDHVSTAYVAGSRRGLVREHELDPLADHRNSYERTKFEAEHIVRQAADRLPVATHRPSIVVGESDFGRTSNFNTLYWPVRVYASGYWRTLPGRLDAPLDIVPVDFVRDAILELRRRPESLGGTYHLAAGPDGAITIGEAIALVESFFPDRRGVRVVDPAWWMRTVHPALKTVSIGRLRRFLSTLEAYAPYLVGNPLFANERALSFLDGTPIRIPSVSSYFDRLIRYCVESDWGRRDRPKSGEADRPTG